MEASRARSIADIALGVAVGVAACLLIKYRNSPKHDSLLETNRYAPWKPLEYSVVFGVVGGLGPRAMTYFLEGLVTERCRLFVAMLRGTNAAERLRFTLEVSSARWTSDEVEIVFAQTRTRLQLLDQDHIPVLAAQATTVPPRPKYILKESKVDPLPQMISVSHGLVAGGATHLAINCNTAHHFWPAVQASLPNTVCLDMVRLALEYVFRFVQDDGHKGKIGLFATTATLQTRMYQDVAEQEFGVDLVSPLDLSSDDGVESQGILESVIFGQLGIKSGYDNPDRNEESRLGLRMLVEQGLKLKRELNCSVVILACSELPLLLNEESLNRWLDSLRLGKDDVEEIKCIKFVDPGRVLTHEMLRTALLSRS